MISAELLARKGYVQFELIGPSTPPNAALDEDEPVELNDVLLVCDRDIDRDREGGGGGGASQVCPLTVSPSFGSAASFELWREAAECTKLRVDFNIDDTIAVDCFAATSVGSGMPRCRDFDLNLDAGVLFAEIVANCISKSPPADARMSTCMLKSGSTV